MSKNAYPTHPEGAKYMDARDLRPNSWQREEVECGRRQFIRQEATPFSRTSPELEAIVAENVGTLAVEQELVAA